MEAEVKLNRVERVLDELRYPVEKDEAVAAASGVTVIYAAGEEQLDTIIARSNAVVFESVSDLEAEIFSNVALEAVGEPGQSEGDA